MCPPYHFRDAIPIPFITLTEVLYLYSSLAPQRSIPHLAKKEDVTLVKIDIHDVNVKEEARVSRTTES